MENIKENALTDYIIMTCQSWTYERMTEEEKSRCLSALRDADTSYKAIAGTYIHRISILQAVYHAYLMGIGYTGHAWREPCPDELPF